MSPGRQTEEQLGTVWGINLSANRVNHINTQHYHLTPVLK